MLIGYLHMFDAFQEGFGDCLEGFSAESLRFSVWKEYPSSHENTILFRRRCAAIHHVQTLIPVGRFQRTSFPPLAQRLPMHFISPADPTCYVPSNRIASYLVPSASTTVTAAFHIPVLD
ncbi:hypothetical protein KSP40_PGU016330 [Platanthera guangdongensis]|uniref:Uncharacterized protein n=1 Tax=Platanthera guangdongensis TaxID=2320717 RepID=A0ABR2M856_9ASPA